VPEKLVALAAPTFTPEENCAMPLAALTSYEALFVRGNLQPNSRILVLGGSSACGMYATYLAKSINCFVAATCSTKNIDVVKSFGADMIIDYTSQHWTEVGQGNMKYDLIFDCVGAEKDEQTL